MPPLPDTIGALGLVIPVGTMKVPVENAAATANGYVTLESIGDVIAIAAGTLASRPAAGTVGRLYFVTDAAVPHLTFDNGTAWLDCVLNGTYTPGTTSPVKLLSEGSDPAVRGTFEGDRRALVHLLVTDTDDENIAGMVIDHVQRTSVGTIRRTGLHIRTYTEADNGGDVSGLLIAASGGGPGLTIYKHYGLRPIGYTNQQLSTQPAMEIGSGDAGAALVASAGSSQWGPPLRNHAIEAVLGAATGVNQSDGILIRSINDVFDDRIALAVCSPSLNAAPVNVTFRLNLSGDMTLTHGLNTFAVTSGETRHSNNTNDASQPLITMRKSRGNGPISVNEILGDFVWVGVDAGSAERAGGRMRVIATAVGAGVVSTSWQLYLSDAGTESLRLSVSNTGVVTPTGRVLGVAGANVTAANDITLGNGNFFVVTGNTQINNIVATGWTAGSQVTLRFTGTPTVKHATAGGGAQIQLAGAADFVASANDSLTLMYDGTVFFEVSRAVI